jgi:hypothetical protein
VTPCGLDSGRMGPQIWSGPSSSLNAEPPEEAAGGVGGVAARALVPRASAEAAGVRHPSPLVMIDPALTASARAVLSADDEREWCPQRPREERISWMVVDELEPADLEPARTARTTSSCSVSLDFVFMIRC